MRFPHSTTPLLLLLLLIGCVAAAADEKAGPAGLVRQPPEQSKRLILAHYMPWYVAKPLSGQWGWHWTMNHFDPERIVDGRRQIASEFYPLIGPYDSGDPQVLEYQLLLMKLAGIDGVIVDWYGLEDFRDYATLHRNTQRLVEQAERLKMKLVICYEDQTIPALVQAHRISSQERVAHARSELQWLVEHWFPLDSYLKIDGDPVVLSFGNAGLNNDEWTECLESLPTPVAYFSEHDRRSAAVGAFDWPIPQQGLRHLQRFNELSSHWRHAIPVAYPRFVDIYAKAKVNDGYGRVADRDGRTFQTTLENAMTSTSEWIQIATWNDWGEGTQIEPSEQYGYRDLELLQRLRRDRIDRDFKPQPEDLRIPHEVLKMRRERQVASDQLDRTVALIVRNELEEARALIASPTRR